MAGYEHALAPGDVYVMAGGSMPQSLLLGPWMSLVGGKKMGIITRPSQKDLMFLKELLEAGKFVSVTHLTLQFFLYSFILSTI